MGGGGGSGEGGSWHWSVCEASTLTCLCVQSLDRVVVQPSSKIGQPAVPQARHLWLAGLWSVPPLPAGPACPDFVVLALGQPSWVSLSCVHLGHLWVRPLDRVVLVLFCHPQILFSQCLRVRPLDRVVFSVVLPFSNIVQPVVPSCVPALAATC